ncbi:MAG: hypothetical protein WBL62_06805 [Gallionella sp.]
MKSELTQIREGNRKIHNWRIVACVLGLCALYALMGKLDADARLDELERIAALRHAAPMSRPHMPVLVEGLQVISGGVL